MVWCVPGGGEYCYFDSSSFLNSAREVIEAPLPQQDHIPSLPPPPGHLTTAKTPSTLFILVQ